MSKRVVELLGQWVDKHIQAEPYVDEEGPNGRPAMYAEQVVLEARTKGIRHKEFEDEVGNLFTRPAP